MMRCGKFWLRGLFYAGMVCVTSGLVVADVYTIDPRETYLRTNQDSAYDAAPLSLAELSLFPGDFIRLQQFGDFRPGTHLTDTNSNMLAVFSASDTLLASSVLARVQDAIDAGTDYTTGATYHGSVTTDIPEDFLVTDVYVQIPPGATHLFVTAADNLYRDNTDPDGDFAVGITRCICPLGDLDSDCFVDLSDFAVLASQWHDVLAEPSADLYPQLDGDGFVDIWDLAVLAENWLALADCE